MPQGRARPHCSSWDHVRGPGARRDCRAARRAGPIRLDDDGPVRQTRMRFRLLRSLTSRALSWRRRCSVRPTRCSCPSIGGNARNAEQIADGYKVDLAPAAPATYAANWKSMSGYMTGLGGRKRGAGGMPVDGDGLDSSSWIIKAIVVAGGRAVKAFAETSRRRAPRTHADNRLRTPTAAARSRSRTTFLACETGEVSVVAAPSWPATRCWSGRCTRRTPLQAGFVLARVRP